MNFIDSLLHDLKHGCRELLSNKAWTAVAVLSLTVGIAANGGVFTMLLPFIEKLPVRNPDELVAFRYGAGVDGKGELSTSRFVYDQMVAANQTLTDLFAFSTDDFDCFGRSPFCKGRLPLVIQGLGEPAAAEYVTGNFFSGLGLHTIRGRILTPSDDVASTPPVAVISHRLWERRFHSAPEAVGASVLVDNQPLTIVGVLSEEARSPMGGNHHLADLFIPMAHQPRVFRAQPGLIPIFSDLVVMGRRKPGVTLKQVEGNFSEVAHRAGETEWNAYLATLTPEERAANPRIALGNGNPRARIFPGSRGMTDMGPTVRRNLEFLAVISGILLVIVCLNVTNLRLAQAAAHQKDIAIRSALGASRGRLIRQMLVQSVVLSMGGAILAVGLTGWPELFIALALPAGVEPPQLPSALDPRTLAFELALAVAAGLAFGIGPALRAVAAEWRGRISLQERPFGGARSRLASALVIGQVGLSITLLVVAGLFVGVLRQVRGANLGFNPENVVLFSINPSLDEPNSSDDNIYADLLARIRALPGVRTAAFSDSPLLSGAAGTGQLSLLMKRVDGKPAGSSTETRIINPDFLRTMEVPLRFGRFFTTDDRQGAPRVVIVNDAFVRAFMTTPNPIGEVVRWGSTPASQQQAAIVGVVGDARTHNLDHPIEPMMYLPYAQSPSPVVFNYTLKKFETLQRPITFEVRVAGNVEAALPSIRDAIRSVDPTLAVYGLGSHKLATEIGLLGDQLLFGDIMRTVSVIALTVAMIGIFSLMSYTVARRTKEIGIRMALGAQRQTVLFSVIRETQLLVFWGVAAGVAFALFLTPVLEMQLYGLSPHDPKINAAVITLTVAIASVAGYLPASRASQVDPLVALREE